MANTVGFQKGHPRFGGRGKGTTNKKTRALAIMAMEAASENRVFDKESIARVLAIRECNPFAVMAEIAMDKKVHASIRGRMAAELATYLAPKLRQVEVTTDKDNETASIMVLSLPKAASVGGDGMPVITYGDPGNDNIIHGGILLPKSQGTEVLEAVLEEDPDDAKI